MARKKEPEIFDAQLVARALEEEAMAVLRDNMRTAEDGLVQNDAAFKIWAIANGYVELH